VRIDVTNKKPSNDALNYGAIFYAYNFPVISVMLLSTLYKWVSRAIS